ncbi:Uncharacterised protein [Chlamydia trachomatis]|nr:Uncharacterised protein [Chlamydia trachomatis]SYV90934.1 Uncharacterised protein [Mesomycoplasma hyorhinis]
MKEIEGSSFLISAITFLASSTGSLNSTQKEFFGCEVIFVSGVVIPKIATFNPLDNVLII